MIDWDAPGGISVRNHGDMQIWMRKSAPGVYYDGTGAEVSTKLAKAAGFPVDDHENERRVQAHLATQEREIRRKIAVEEHRIRNMGKPPFREKHTGQGNYAVLDSGGKNLTRNVKLTAEQAQQLAHRMCETLYHRQAGYSADEIAELLGLPPAVGERVSGSEAGGDEGDATS